MLGGEAKARKTPKEKDNRQCQEELESVYVEHILQAGKKWLAEDHKQHESFKRTLEKEVDR